VRRTKDLFFSATRVKIEEIEALKLEGHVILPWDEFPEQAKRADFEGGAELNGSRAPHGQFNQ